MTGAAKLQHAAETRIVECIPKATWHPRAKRSASYQEFAASVRQPGGLIAVPLDPLLASLCCRRSKDRSHGQQIVTG